MAARQLCGHVCPPLAEIRRHRNQINNKNFMNNFQTSIKSFFKHFCLGLIFLVMGIIFSNSKAHAQLADSSWPMFHGNSKLTGQSNVDTSKTDGTIKWQLKTQGQIETSPVIGIDGTIYIADQTCYLYAITPQGSEKWKVKLGEPVTSKEWGGSSCFQSTPAVAKDNTIYAFPMSGYFYALNPDGSEKWKIPIFTFKNDWSSPTIAKDGTIYIGSELYPPHETGKPAEKTASVYALNPNGTVKWSYDTKGVWVTSTSSIADDGTMYTSANDCVENQCKNTIFAFAPDGKIKWKYVIRDGVNEGSIAIGSDGTIYFDGKGERNPRVNAFFYALNPDGTEKWKYLLPDGVSMTPGLSNDGKIYFGDWNGTFYALNLEGKLLWKVQTPSAYEALSSSPAISKDGTVYFGTIANHFYAYNPDGSKKWQIKLEEGGVNSSPAIGADGIVYFASIPGRIYAVGSKEDIRSTPAMSFSKSSDNIFLFKIIILGLFAALPVVLLIMFLTRKHDKKYIYCFLVSIIILGLALYILPSIFNKDNYDNNRNGYSEMRQNNDFSNPKKIDEKDCPHHVYGTKETGWYGAYGMQTKDLNDKEVDQIRQNCPDATFQAGIK